MRRGEGAHPVDGGGRGLGGGQTAGVGHRNGDGAGHNTAGAAELVGARDGFHHALHRLKGTAEGNGGALAHGKGGGIHGGELQGQQHDAVVPQNGQFLTGLDRVTHPHREGNQSACRRGADILGVHRLVVAALGLLQRDLGGLELVGGIGTVEDIEHFALFNIIAHFKIGAQDGALHQRGDVVAVCGSDGAGVAQGVGDVSPLGAGFNIIQRRGGCGLGPEFGDQNRRANREHTGSGGEALPVLFTKG